MPIPALTAPPWDRRDLALCAALFGVLLGIFLWSPATGVIDSKYSLLLTHSLISRGSFALDGYGIPVKPVVEDGAARLNGGIYQVEVVNGHLYAYFPPGSPVLSAPFVLVAEACGLSVVRPDGTYSFAREVRLQRMIAAGLMAFLAVMFYATARLLVPMGPSAVVAVGGALGTQVWSTASRALWTHTWGISLLGGAVWLLLARETGRGRLRPALLATVLSWAYFVRPTNSLFIAGITIYVLLYAREAFVIYAATGAAWFVGFVGYSRWHFDTFLPSYFQAKRLGMQTFGEALAGNLVSPSRGLVVYVPVVVFVVYLTIRYRRHLPLPRLAWLAAGVSVGHLLAVSCFVPWYGGGCFGPRYTTELVPWFVLLATLGTRAALDWRAEHAGPDAPSGWRATLGMGSLLLFMSVAIQARGACAPAAMLWNQHPVPVDEEPTRVWNWRQPQFLAGLIYPPLPARFPSLDAGRVLFGDSAGKAFQLAGWSVGEPDYSWSEETRATLIFATTQMRARRLRMCFEACFGKVGKRRQRVTVRLNGRRMAKFVVREVGPREYTLDLPEGSLRRENFLTFELPDAVPPLSLSDEEQRALGIALRWVELEARE